VRAVVITAAGGEVGRAGCLSCRDDDHSPGLPRFENVGVDDEIEGKLV
jgi:hypothetical protein